MIKLLTEFLIGGLGGYYLMYLVTMKLFEMKPEDLLGQVIIELAQKVEKAEQERKNIMWGGKK